MGSFHICKFNTCRNLSFREGNCIKKSLNVLLYQAQILKKALVRPWKNMVSRWRGWGATPFIVEDGARVHTAKICLKERKKHGYRMLVHPPLLP